MEYFHCRFGGVFDEIMNTPTGITGEVSAGYDKLLIVSYASEQLVFLHEWRNVYVKYSAAMLDQVVSGDQILRIVVSDAFERSVFPILRVDAVHDCHSNLDIRVIYIVSVENKVAFQLSNSADADVIAFGPGISIHDVFQCGAVIDSFVSIQGKVKTQIGKIVFLLP